MNLPQLLIAAIVFLLAILSLIIAILQWQQKGPIFTNSYLLASKGEREKLDKPAEYRLAARVFSGIFAAFLFCGMAILTSLAFFTIASIVVMAGLLVYIIANAVHAGMFR